MADTSPDYAPRATPRRHPGPPVRGAVAVAVLVALTAGGAAAYPAGQPGGHPAHVPAATRGTAPPAVSPTARGSASAAPEPGRPADPDPTGAARGPSGGPTVAARPRYPVLVVGHRGAPAYRPEHTLEGYQLAVDQGADFVEADLVMTADRQLIARHESDLTDTTDVRQHPELAGLARGGRWYAERLTLAQIRTLRAVGGPPEHSGRYRIPTLGEIVLLVQRQPRRVGLYVELKSPARLRRLGLAPEEPLAAALRAAGWRTRAAPVYVQSFEADSLRRVRRLIDVRLVQLLPAGAAATGAELDTVARYAHAIGVDRDRLRSYLDAPPPDATNLVRQAAARGLAVHVYTLGDQAPHPAPAGFAHPVDPPERAAVVAVYRAYYALGVVAVFSDAPDVAVYARG